MEFMLTELLSEQDLNPSEHPILIVEPLFQPRDFRSKVVELLFDKFGFKGVFFQKAPVLASYLFGANNTVVIDSGASHSTVVPVQDGYVNQKALIKSHVAGDYLTHKMLDALNGQV